MSEGIESYTTASGGQQQTELLGDDVEIELDIANEAIDTEGGENDESFDGNVADETAENAGENAEGENEAEDENEAEAEEEAEPKHVEVRPVLTRGKLVFMYGATNSLRTVFIKPFKPEFFNEKVRAWIEQTVEYEIKSDRHGVSAAALYYDSNELGDEAFRCLRVLLEPEGAKVYHPPFTSKTACLAHEWFLQLFSFKLEGDYSHRMISLENLPDSVTEMAIKEKFPEAFNIIFYGNDESCKGIATLELPTEDKVDALLAETNEIELDGEKVPLHKLNYRINKWTKELKSGMYKSARQDNEREREARATKDLTDEERIEKCEQYHRAMTLKDTVKDSMELFGDAKIEAHEEYAQELKYLSLSMMFDTNRRYKETQTFPEPEELMLPYTKQVIAGTTVDSQKEDRKKERNEKRKEKRREEKARNAPAPYKRANSGSRGREPPSKRGYYDDGGYGRDRRGRRDERRWDREDYRDGGRRDRFSGGGGNRFMKSQMENAIMGLAEKMTQLERLQMNQQGGMGGGFNMGGMQGDSNFGNMGGGYGGGGFGGGGGSFSGGGGGGNYNRKRYGFKRN